MFDVLATIIGNLDDEATAMAFARDLEEYLVRAHRLGLIVEIRNDRLARTIHKRIAIPGTDRSDGGGAA
ncbi:MAG: hypothetical protein F8N37_21630 [Telmatospirillum sp.]|nr:hypothetical protein [Telmatospirillum sp.]